MKLDVLAFGVHPDDVELGCAGTLLKEQLRGQSIGIVDLTGGELGTRGTTETRKKEAGQAAKILNLSVRENLAFADGFFQNDEAHQRKVIEVIRKYRPEIVICNAPEDRHPDHGRSASLVSDAAFLSGLRKIDTKDSEGNSLEAWRPKLVLHYLQDRYLNPDFVVDITEVFEKKIESIEAYETQFHNPASGEPETYISSPDFLDSIVYRAKMLGKMIGVKYAEGFITKKIPGLANLGSLILKDT